MNLNDITFLVERFLYLAWPFFVFVFVLPIVESTWLFWRNETFKHKAKFVLLELHMPREVVKNPKGMEQVLVALHTLGNAPGTFLETWWDGETPLPVSLELVSFGGEVHFYVRCREEYRHLVEAAFFSYYSDVEVIETEDYVSKFPMNASELFGQNYNMWGTEMILNREPIYPIKNYSQFEAVAEEQQYDPISAFLEILGKVKLEEKVAIQFLLAASPKDWYKPWMSVLEKLKESKPSKKKTGTAWSFPGGPLPALSVSGGTVDEGPKFMMRTPGETDVLEAIENNISKPAFDTIIRMVYFSPKPLFFFKFARNGLVGAFNQYASASLNSFGRNNKVSTEAKFDIKPYIFPRVRDAARKDRMLYNYSHRDMPPETFMGKLISSYFFHLNFYSKRQPMNVETIATLFHPPTAVVLTAPHVKRVTSRKTGPPAGVAIFGEEKEMEKFQ